jgi:hypothetical protein
LGDPFLCNAKYLLISGLRATLKRKNAPMKSLNTKLVLSALGIVAMLTGPAFAKKAHQATQANEPANYMAIPGYDRDGAVVGIPDPDQSRTQPQR